MRRLLFIFSFILSAAISLPAQDFLPDEQILYKNTAQGELNLHVFYPDGLKTGKDRPAIVFFFGGSWTGGTPKQFYAHSRYLAAQGMVAIAAEYRIKNTHGSTPVESVMDGKSAIRWVRKHAAELGVDPEKIVASGGSAGGHVAACTGIIEGFEEEDQEVSSVPNVMVLYNPALDISSKLLQQRFPGFEGAPVSPLLHVRAGLPPTMVFHGTEDRAVPFGQAAEFQRKMSDLGNLCVLMTSVGQPHSFFNSSHFADRFDNIYFNKTIYETHFFLKETGILDHLPVEWMGTYPKVMYPSDNKSSRHGIGIEAHDSEKGFVRIFNGSSLDGWDGDPIYWSVKDGAILGKITAETVLDRNTFLIWREGTTGDFELKLEFRISEEGNSGICYRCMEVSGVPWALKGYQLDIDGKGQWMGQNYQEKVRTFLALRGQVTRISEGEGPVMTGSVGNMDLLKEFVEKDGWNQAHLIVRGGVMIHILNGQVMSIVVDDDPLNRTMDGLLGFQVHTGPPMTVEFKNIMIKRH